jgi:chromosome segregation protein
MVVAPVALARSLSQIGLVDDEASALSCQADLSPGQILVSRGGAVWRWDGYTIRAGTPTSAAVRLRQRNRLAVLREALLSAEQEAARAGTALREAEQAARRSAAEEQAARDTRRNCERGLERALAELTQLRNQAATTSARIAGADEQLLRLTNEYQEAAATLEAARTEHAARPALDELRDSVQRSRAVLAQARAREAAALSARDAVTRDHKTCVERRRVIASERALWIERARDAETRVVDLGRRLENSQRAMVALEAAPAKAAVRQAEALEALCLAEAAHTIAAERLAVAVGSASEADRASRAAELALADRREAAVRAEGWTQRATVASATISERILERLGVDPALPTPPADLTPEIEGKARGRFERLTKEREDMGPVNLRAETEAEVIENQIATIGRERDELLTAIARLRGSIGNLNREGRERLSAVFQAVDRHFQQLFGRMFGGGRAHLALVGSDDPLQAGLEIYAQPPGKKLAALSLLSGGEQALTALSLIFAVFRCNPAPICVLDEVDAPLDDANVERFCLLLEDIERETKTRFLVVTHHPMTMARMDRLYGVTMQERGVSRVLSVDLTRAAAMSDQRQLPLDEQSKLAAD